jgi:hypothetical protein
VHQRAPVAHAALDVLQKRGVVVLRQKRRRRSSWSVAGASPASPTSIGQRSPRRLGSTSIWTVAAWPGLGN